MNPDKLKISTTTDGKPPRPGFENAAAPAPIDLATGMHEAYWVLSPEERAKGFIRPVRSNYIHTGRRVCGKPEWIHAAPFVCSMEPGHDGDCIVHSPVKDQAEQERVGASHRLGGCGAITSMGRALAETYARDPSYYGATFCAHCGNHFPVGAAGEFNWAVDGRDTGEKVGT